MYTRRACIGVLFAILVAGAVSYLTGEGFVPTFAELRADRVAIEAFLMEDPVLGVAIFSGIYITAVALSLPIATPLTVLSGFLFGSFLGTAIVAFSAAVGAVIIFVLARFFFRAYFQAKFKERLEWLNREFKTHGFRDILILRLMPIVPFSLINVAAALTSTRLREYVLATLIGTLPFTFVYVSAGMRLSEIQSLSDVFSFKTLLIVSLAIAALAIPLLIRRRRSAPPGSSETASAHRPPQE